MLEVTNQLGSIFTTYIVQQVIVVHNNELIDENGDESEAKGIVFCKSIFGEHTRWTQTSYNGSTKKLYAGVGYKYDENNNVFIAPKPYNSWNLNPETFDWEAPIPYPNLNDGKKYKWDEETLSWVEM